jgi:hypothetical protein
MATRTLHLDSNSFRFCDSGICNVFVYFVVSKDGALNTSCPACSDSGTSIGEDD